jgi:hypothetical protein
MASTCRAAAATAWAWCSCRRTPPPARPASAFFEDVVRRARAARHRLARRAPPTRPTSAASRAQRACRSSARSTSRAPRGAARSSASSTSSASSREPHPRQRGVDANAFPRRQLSAETIVYKGLLLPEQLPQFYADLRDPSWSARWPGALALLDQHLPDLGPGAAVALHRPQRRDQHAARQPQLDERAPQPAAVGQVRGPLERLFPIIVPGKSDSAQFDNMLELLVLAGRSAAARDDDDDPRGVGEHTRRWTTSGARSTSTPLADGAVGRPGRDRLHRRALIGATLDRNGLRPRATW